MAWPALRLHRVKREPLSRYPPAKVAISWPDGAVSGALRQAPVLNRCAPPDTPILP